MGKVFDSAASFHNDWKEYSEDLSIPKMSVSVVIPVYKPTCLDEVIHHLSLIGGIKEIILIDDLYMGTPGIKKFNVDGIEIKYFANKLKPGSPAVRNIGVAKAEGDILLFIDQDMFLDPKFLDRVRELLVANNNHGVILGLRDTVKYEDIPRFEHWVSPDAEKDWRRNTIVNANLVDITAGGVGGLDNKCEVGKKLQIYKKTNKLRDLGVRRENTIGVWDLPSMVAGHTIAVTRNDFYQIGCFPEFIVGWGGDDIAFGFLAVARHIPIILTQCVSYHVQHIPHSGSTENNLSELRENMEKYQKWAQELDKFPTCDLETWKNQAERIV